MAQLVKNSPAMRETWDRSLGWEDPLKKGKLVVSDSVRPHRRQPTRLPHPWDSPGKNTGVGCHFRLPCMKVKSESEVAQSCLTLSDSMDCSLPGSSLHEIFQARVREWGAIAFSKGKDYPLQYSGLENSMDSIVHWVTKSWTRLSDLLSQHHLAMIPGVYPLWHQSPFQIKRVSEEKLFSRSPKP